jgi:hypothetical protein
VQAAHDLHPRQWLTCGIALANDHETGHFLLGQPDFFAAEFASDRSATLKGNRPAFLAMS